MSLIQPYSSFVRNSTKTASTHDLSDLKHCYSSDSEIIELGLFRDPTLVISLFSVSSQFYAAVV